MRELQFEEYLNRQNLSKSSISTYMSDARAVNRLINGGLDNFFAKDVDRPLPKALLGKSNKSADSHLTAANHYRRFLREKKKTEYRKYR